jgi:hypothetical protein
MRLTIAWSLSRGITAFIFVNKFSAFLWLELHLIHNLIFHFITGFIRIKKDSFLISWGGMRLSPLGTSATNWSIVPAPDDK